MPEDEISLFDESFSEKKPEPKPPQPQIPEPIPPADKGVALTCRGARERSVTTGVVTSYEVALDNRSPLSDTVRLNVDIIYTALLGEGAAEWSVTIDIEGEERWEVTHTKQMTREFYVGARSSIPMQVLVSSPTGARYGDTIRVVMTAQSSRDPAIYSSITLSTTAKQSILVVKAQIGQERAVADTLAARSKDVGLMAILNPAPLRGYLLVEGMKTDRLEEIVRGIRKARGMVAGETTIDDIAHYLTPKPLISGIVEGDIVELVAGPFKGEKARVRSIDEGKEEITVELFEALVPMPVTVKGDSVRVIEKEK
ncbi:MAG: transcription elongation factor Spt5 [Candidatus Thermoplasmatota archaeon]